MLIYIVQLPRLTSAVVQVGYPMPRDLASMLHVKEQQQKQQSATSSAAASPTPKEAKIAPRFASPSPGQVPASKPVKSKAGPDLVEIPSFAELQQRKVAKDLGAKKAEAWVKNNHAAPTTGAPQGAPSTASRFSATAKEFKPNPNAISFKPVRACNHYVSCTNL